MRTPFCANKLLCFQEKSSRGDPSCPAPVHCAALLGRTIDSLISLTAELPRVPLAEPPDGQTCFGAPARLRPGQQRYPVPNTSLVRTAQRKRACGQTAATSCMMHELDREGAAGRAISGSAQLLVPTHNHGRRKGDPHPRRRHLVPEGGRHPVQCAPQLPPHANTPAEALHPTPRWRCGGPAGRSADSARAQCTTRAR